MSVKTAGNIFANDKALIKPEYIKNICRGRREEIMSQDNDKRELLKLKQGLIEKSDTVQMPQNAGEKTKNWLWYHKVILIVGVLVIAVAAVIAAFFYFKPKPDIGIYSLSWYSSTTRRLLESNLPRYCPDFNGDGQYVVTVTQAPDDPALGFIEKYEEIENGTSQIFIGKKEDIEQMSADMTAAGEEEYFADLSEIGAEGYMLEFSASPIGKELKIFSQEIYIAVKNTNDENEQNAVEFVDNIIHNKEVKNS